MVNDKTFRVRLDGVWLNEGDAAGCVIECETEDYTHEVVGATHPLNRLTGRRRVLLHGHPVGTDAAPDGWREPGDWLVIE